MLEVFLGDRIYTQRTPNSKIVEFSLEGEKINTYDELPQKIKDIIELNENMENFPDDYFEYEIKNNEVEIISLKDCSDINDYIKIPDTIKGYPVTKMKSIFSPTQKKRIKQIQLPDSINKISFEAFAGFEKLEEINIPKSLKSLPTNCFRGCYSLTHIELNNLEKIGSGAFLNCRKLRKIDLSNVAELGEKIFCECASLESVKLPSNITILPDYTFYECKKLKKVNLSDQIKLIGKSAFCGCECLEEINIPKQLIRIEQNAFRESEIKVFNAPENLKNIKQGAFWHSAIEEINLNKQLETIGEFAFSHCKKIKKISMYENTYYDKDAFDYVNKLKIQIINDEKTKK